MCLNERSDSSLLFLVVVTIIHIIAKLLHHFSRGFRILSLPE